MLRVRFPSLVLMDILEIQIESIITVKLDWQQAADSGITDRKMAARYHPGEPWIHVRTEPKYLGRHRPMQLWLVYGRTDSVST